MQQQNTSKLVSESSIESTQFLVFCFLIRGVVDYEDLCVEHLCHIREVPTTKFCPGDLANLTE